MKQSLLISFMLLCSVLSLAVSSLGQATDPIIYPDDPREFANQFRKLTFSPGHIAKKPGHYTIADWQNAIDSTWGWGLSKTEKLQIFDTFWDTIDDYFACFNGIDVNWDSLRTVYRTEIENGDATYGVSRGRFGGIIHHLCLSLMESHTFADDSYIYNTALDPGIPLFVVGGWGDNGHFGAGLTPLPDNSLLVYKTVQNHPLGIEPGDIILGYDGIPWVQLSQELREAQLPTAGWWWGSCSTAFDHSMLMNAGMNWHLFDTLDVVKHNTGDTLHLSTVPLVGQDMQLWCTEQMNIPGVPMPDYNAGERASFGIIDGTQIGYIYVIAWSGNVQSEFYQAVYQLMNNYETTGLIIDFRTNYGGNMFLSNPALSLLFNEDVETIDWGERCDPDNHIDMCPLGIYESYIIPGSPSSYYNKPIAVLVGPGALSSGDQVALRFKFHPRSKFFGKTTATAFNSPVWEDLGDESWVFRFAFYDPYLLSNPGFYLTHQQLGIDEEVWLTPDNIVQGIDDVVQAAIEWINICYYVPGDVNMANGAWPPTVIGGDVTYLVNYFRGLSSSQPCILNGFWHSADVNGDCNIIGSDVTKLVNYFRGQTDLNYCADYQPAWPTLDDLPEEAPPGWPNCE